MDLPPQFVRTVDFTGQQVHTLSYKQKYLQTDTFLADYTTFEQQNIDFDNSSFPLVKLCNLNHSNISTVNSTSLEHLFINNCQNFTPTRLQNLKTLSIVETHLPTSNLAYFYPNLTSLYTSISPSNSTLTLPKNCKLTEISPISAKFKQLFAKIHQID